MSRLLGGLAELQRETVAVADDELRYDSQRPSIAGYSDRFTLKFRKPAQ